MAVWRLLRPVRDPSVLRDVEPELRRVVGAAVAARPASAAELAAAQAPGAMHCSGAMDPNRFAQQVWGEDVLQVPVASPSGRCLRSVLPVPEQESK